MFSESNISEELSKVKKQICVRYFIIIISVFSFFSIYYTYQGVKPLSYLIILCTIIHLLWFYIPYKLSYESIRPLLPLYFSFIILALYPNSMYFWSIGQLTPFMWYTVIPVAAMVFFPSRIALFWSIFVFILICSIFLLSPIIPSFAINHFTEKQQMTLNIATIISCLILIFFFLFYMNKINQIKDTHLFKEYEELKFSPESVENIDSVNADEEDIEKYNNLYDEILNYFAEKKPYCDPDFSISQLAVDLNTNTKYVSKAIKNNRDVNFNEFVNNYRIDFVKNMLTKDFQNKYTLRYIYISAGFRHQSTFNKAFKRIEGTTPSDYIRILIKKGVLSQPPKFMI